MLTVLKKRGMVTDPEVSGEIVEKVDPVFFSDPQTAAAKALGIALRTCRFATEHGRDGVSRW